MAFGHRLVTARSVLNGIVWQYAICAECWNAAGSVEEERAERVEPLAENIFEDPSRPEWSCHYCGMEIVVHTPEILR